MQVGVVGHLLLRQAAGDPRPADRLSESDLGV